MSRREEDLRTRDLLPDADRGRDEPAPAETGQQDPHQEREAVTREPDGGNGPATAASPNQGAQRADTTQRRQPAEPDRPPGNGRTLVDPASTERYRNRWMDVQAAFVDEPRRAVAEADGLVAEIIQRLAETFAREREGLEQQWGRGDEVSTEDLRVAMQRYRAFFDRLLSA
jgi:hypothetical protein